MSVYSDSRLEKHECPTCHGTGLHRTKDGLQCGRCLGAGFTYPLRRDELAKAFADGNLPEQQAAPQHRWCQHCRPRGAIRRNKNGKPLYLDCVHCNGRTIVEICQTT